MGSRRLARLEFEMSPRSLTPVGIGDRFREEHCQERGNRIADLSVFRRQRSVESARIRKGLDTRSLTSGKGAILDLMRIRPGGDVFRIGC